MLLGLIFTQKKSAAHSLFATEISTPPTTQSQHELTCCKNCRGDEREEADQDKDCRGVFFKGKSMRDGGEYKGGKNQEDEERGGGMCKLCDGE